MLDRMDSYSHCSTFNPSKGRFYDDFGEDLVQIGSNSPFPESGIAAVAFLHGFAGVTATTMGLHICPQLPSTLDFLQVEVNYHGQILSINIRKQTVKPLSYSLTIPQLQIKANIPAGDCYKL